MSDISFDCDKYRVTPGQHVSLADCDPADTQGLTDDKKVDRRFDKNRDQMDDWQEKLYAEGKQSLLIVLQGMDTAGKDSTIRKVIGDLNPQGARVSGFKKPSDRELARDFLWRVHRETPAAGMIGVFNRSHYEDVLIVRVHGWASEEELESRYGHINAFEKLLADRGTRVIKLMLHISKDYQLQRLRRRLENPDKWWKFNPADLDERKLWEDYQRAFEIALGRCSTEQAPWYVIPAENRWFRDLVVSQIIVDALAEMNPAYPQPTFDRTDFPPESLR